jgi:hypothetical protein
VLPALERREVEIERRLVAADDLDDDADFRGVEDLERIAGDRHVPGVAGLLRVADGRADEPHGPSGGGVDALLAIGERTRDRAPDDAQT